MTSKLPTRIILVALSLCMLLVPLNTAEACQGTPKRTCARTIWLTVLTPANVALPANGQVQMRVVLVPFVFWDTSPACAQPSNPIADGKPDNRASNIGVTILAKFVSLETQELVELAIQNFDLPAPSAPGLQAPMEVMVTVPDGVLNRNEPWVADLSVVATAAFQGGNGGGPLSASASATGYLVPASEADPNKPAIDIQYIPDQQMNAFVRCRRGDQTYMHFLVTNNRLTTSVNLNLESLVGQVAGLPDGFSGMTPQEIFSAGVFAISDPEGDFFNHAIVLDPATWPQLPEGDPHNNPSMQTGQVTLGAAESKLITIAIRSFGMCSNGSCNKVTLFGEGVFSDGLKAIACASTAIVVDDVAAKSRRCEIEDEIKTSPEAASCFSGATFVDFYGDVLPHATTNATGNVDPSFNASGYWLYGDKLGMTGQISQMTDNIRFDEGTDAFGAVYGVNQSGVLGFTNNTVIVAGLPDKVGNSVFVPIIFFQEDPNLVVLVDFEEDVIVIQSNDGSEIYFEGSYIEFLLDPPTGFFVDVETCRTFTKTHDTSKNDICTDRYGIVSLCKDAAEPSYQVGVSDQAGQPIIGNISVLGAAFSAVQVGSPTFNGSFTFDVDKDKVPEAPNRISGYFNLNAPSAIAPLLVPIVLSKMNGIVMLVKNEQELLDAVRAITARAGLVEVQFGTPQIDLTTLSKGQWGPRGDRFQLNGLVRSPLLDGPVIIDGSDCPAPCFLFDIDGNDNVISDMIFQNFPGDVVTLSGGGNTIELCAFNDGGGSGIVIDTGVGNALLSNTFSGNTDIAIDLGNDGSTPNDAGDVDDGPNGLQNAPVINDSESTAGGTQIIGTFNSAANTTYSVQYYISDTCHASEVKTALEVLDTRELTTDGNGDAAIDETFNDVSGAGQYVSAIAIDPDGNTSEFSSCVLVEETSAVNALDNDVFKLDPLFPNPASDVTTIVFEMKTSSDVYISIVDLLGRAVGILNDGFVPSGVNRMDFDTGTLPGGVYLVHMQAGPFSATRKLIVRN